MNKTANRTMKMPAANARACCTTTTKLPVKNDFPQHLERKTFFRDKPSNILEKYCYRTLSILANLHYFFENLLQNKNSLLIFVSVR